MVAYQFVNSYCYYNSKDEDEVTEFSDLIRKNREKRSLSMRALERLLRERNNGPSISRSLISYLETGDRVPTYDVAYEIAEALEMDPIDAIEAAYISRVKHGQEKEEKYLKDFRDKAGLEWDPDDIIRRARRKLKL